MWVTPIPSNDCRVYSLTVHVLLREAAFTYEVLMAVSCILCLNTRLTLIFLLGVTNYLAAENSLPSRKAILTPPGQSRRRIGVVPGLSSPAVPVQP